MPDERITKEVVELIDIGDSVPAGGSRVLALTKGGALVHAIWGSDSKNTYVAWAAYPKIPKRSKERMMEPFK